VSEQSRVQSTYASSHWPSHFAPIPSSLKTNYLLAIITGQQAKTRLYRLNDRRKNSRAGFWMNQIQEIRAGRGKKQNQYFISHNNDEIIDRHSNIKEN